MTRRELAKAERRERIVQAAITLSEAAGMNGFSMRDLAKQAGVSHATPFNLFGSKAEIVSQVFEEDLAGFRAALLSRHDFGDLDIFFVMVSTAMNYFRHKGALYRSLHSDFQMRADGSILRRFSEPREKLFAEVVAALQRNGVLDSTLAPELIASACYHLWEAVLLRWVRGAIEIDRMHNEICFGIAALLTGFATPKAQPELQEQMHRFHSAIQHAD